MSLLVLSCGLTSTIATTITAANATEIAVFTIRTVRALFFVRFMVPFL